MSVSDDVGNLFRRFGGDAGKYQEVARDDDAKHAALRWPLLNALDIAHTGPVPEAGRAVSGAHAQRQTSVAHDTRAADASNAATDAGASKPARPPLFARGHRHTSMPPPVAPTQAGASRFSAPPAAVSSEDRANAAANAASMSTASAVETAERAAQASPVQTPPASAVRVQPASVAPVAQMPPLSSTSFMPPVIPVSPQPAADVPPAASPFATPQREARTTQGQPFARASIEHPFAQSARTVPPTPASQQGGSILAGLFSDKRAAQHELAGHPQSKDLATLFARLSRGTAAPARSLRDSLRSRSKADGDA